MPSHGVVPPTLGLRGAIGYFTRGISGGAARGSSGDAEADGGGSGSGAAAEEAQALLARGSNLPSSAAATTTSSTSAGGAPTANGTARPLQQHAFAVASSTTSTSSHPRGGGGNRPLPHGGDFILQHAGAGGAGGAGMGSAAAEEAPPPPGAGTEHSSSNSTTTSSKACKYESLDYELIENTVYRTDAASATPGDAITAAGVKWGICFALGVITAAAAFGVNFGVENLAGFKFWATLTLLERGHGIASFLVYVAINCSLVLGSVALTLLVAPAAAGSGIAEVKAYLNGIDVPGIFLARTLGVKLAGSVGAVAGGLAVGKEGPFVHAGACLGALLSQGGSVGRSSGSSSGGSSGGGRGSRCQAWFRRHFWNDKDRADFVACGTAAGVAAAFRSPVGGVLFALEEMTSWFRNELLWYAFFTTAIVSVALRALMRVCQSSAGGGGRHSAGTCGFFGSGGYLLYEITAGQENFEILELFPVLLLGVIGGLLGAAFTWLNEQLAEWRKEVLLPYGTRGRLVEAAAAALITSTLSFMLPLMTPCQPCPPPDSAGGVCPRVDNTHSGNFVNFGCPAPGQYNDLATIFFNTQDDAIRNLFSAQTKYEYSVSSLLTFSTIFFLQTVLCYGVALPTGLFVPGILCGAAYGRLVGVFVADLRPLVGVTSIDEGTYALLGAASFLGGSMRMTVATCVMLLELTNNLALLPLMMLVTLVAKAVGDGTGMRPIYESLMVLKGLPYLEPQPHALAHHITAAEGAGRPAVTFARVERVGAILRVLRATQHNGFAVIERGPDGEPHIMGVVLRSQLLVLLRSRRCFQPTSFVSELAGRVAFSYQGSDFVRPISGGSSAQQQRPRDDASRLRLSDQEQAMFIDLGPYANPSYYVVQEDTSLAKVHTLFRALGLRHLAVIPRASSVVGVITRHDLTEDSLADACADASVGVGAGAAGLATALRGTVRQALDAYQHTQAGQLLATRGSSGSGSMMVMAPPHGGQHQHHQYQQQLAMVGGTPRHSSRLSSSSSSSGAAVGFLMGRAGSLQAPSRAEGLRIALGGGSGAGGSGTGALRHHHHQQQQQHKRPSWTPGTAAAAAAAAAAGAQQASTDGGADERSSRNKGQQQQAGGNEALQPLPDLPQQQPEGGGSPDSQATRRQLQQQQRQASSVSTASEGWWSDFDAGGSEHGSGGGGGGSGGGQPPQQQQQLDGLPSSLPKAP